MKKIMNAITRNASVYMGALAPQAAALRPELWMDGRDGLGSTAA